MNSILFGLLEWTFQSGLLVERIDSLSLKGLPACGPTIGAWWMDAGGTALNSLVLEILSLKENIVNCYETRSTACKFLLTYLNRID